MVYGAEALIPRPPVYDWQYRGNIESDRLHKLIHPGEDGKITACARATASSLA